jgi:hypothetical protein
MFAMVDGIVRLNTYRIYNAGTLVREPDQRLPPACWPDNGQADR